MKKYLPGFILFVIFLSLFPGTKKEELETRLTSAAGKERIEILAALTEAYRETAPQKALKYGQEGLELLKDFPYPERQVDLLNNLFLVNWYIGKYPESLQYGEQSLRIAKKINYKRGYADALYHHGRAYYDHDFYDRALDFLSQAQKIYEELDDPIGVAKTFNHFGATYWRLGDYSRALAYLIESCKTFESRKETTDRYNNDLAYSYNVTGLIYLDMKDYNKAMEYLLTAGSIHESSGDKRGAARALNNIAFIYMEQGQYPMALNYYQESLKIHRELGFKHGNAIITANIGKVYEKMGNYPKALDYFFKALAISKEINQKRAISSTLIRIGSVKRKLGHYQEAIQRVNQALDIAARMNVKEELQDAYRELSEIYTALNDHGKTLYYLKKTKEIYDSVFNEENNLKIARMHTRYEMEKKEREIALMRKNKALQALELKRQKNFNAFIILVSFLTLIAVAVIYTRYRVKIKMNRALTREVEEHKQTVKKLQESEETFRVLAEASLVGIYICQDRVIKYVNPHFLTLFGYTREELVGETPLKLVIAEDHPVFRENMKRQISGTGVMDTDNRHYQFRGRAKNGEILELESYGGLIHYQGKPAVLETVIDITDRKKTGEKLLRSQKLEAMGILAGGIAHDFNNLITVMMGYLEMVKDDIPGDFPAYGKIEEIERAQNQAIDLGQKLITFTRGDSMIHREVTLNSILEATLATYPQMKSFIGDISIPPRLKPFYGNERQLKQVVINLLRNAREAQPHKEGPGITIAAENIQLPAVNDLSLAEGDYIRIIFKDNGPGIPQRQLNKVFELFYSGHNTPGQKRMGLGLAICHSIIKKHKGDISIKSEVGKGTTVELLLPAFKA